MRIVLIGSGNVATVLGRKLLAAKHIIVQVYSRRMEHAALLAAELKATAVSEVADLLKDADIYILAISDDELYKLTDWKFTTSRPVVHTAGSVTKDVLREISRNYGVLYPLQTLRKEINTINDIPLLIDGSSAEIITMLQDLAGSVSQNVQYADDDTRRKLHLAAVIINNFSNHLYTLTEAYCAKENIDFNMLLPLIAEGAGRIKDHLPKEMQTGPAARHDLSTIARQKELLAYYPELLKVYELFTDSIMNSRQKQILPKEDSFL